MASQNPSVRRLPCAFQSLKLTSHEFILKKSWMSEETCRRCDLSLEEARKGGCCDDGVPVPPPATRGCYSFFRLQRCTAASSPGPALARPVLLTLVSQKAAGSIPLSSENFDRHPSTVVALFIKISASSQEQHVGCLKALESQFCDRSFHGDPMRAGATG